MIEGTVTPGGTTRVCIQHDDEEYEEKEIKENSEEEW